MIELRVLGPVDLWTPDGAAAARVLSQPKRLALLTYLAVKPRGFHRRDTLVALFWPDLDQEHARAALRNTLSFLRRKLGARLIVTRGDEVAVAAEELRCDAAEFDAALDEGRAEQALTLHRGDFLQGLHVPGAPAFAHWLDLERERMRKRTCEAAWQLVEAHERAGLSAAATHWMRVALEIDPDDEAGLRRLLRALDAIGDRAGALRAYDRFARRLALEFEIAPSPETAAVVAGMRARANTPDHQARDVPAAGSISVAVLSLRNIGSESASDYYSAALSEEIAADLSAFPGLRVIARSSSSRLGSTMTDPRAIGEALNVDYVVDGTVRRGAGMLVVTARLTDTKTEATVWAEVYSGSTDDLFDIQERVTQAIRLRLGVAGASSHGARHRHRGSVHAYDCYHRAMEELSRYSEQGLVRALEHVRNGLQLIGENELLLATTAYVYLQFLELGVKPHRRYLDKAQAYVTRALGANPRSCLGHVVQGLISYKRGDIAATARELKAALEIDPNHRDALFWLSVVCLSAGREAVANPFIAQLLDVDPLTPVNHCLPGYAELLRGNAEGALSGYRRMHRMDSGNPVARWFLALVLGRCGRRAEAVALLDQILRDTPGTTFARHALCYKHALERNRGAALAAVTPQLLNEARWDPHASWWMAATYALIDEEDAALHWISNASSLGYINYPFLSRLDPFLDTLRASERFWTLMAQVKEQWERFTP